MTSQALAAVPTPDDPAAVPPAQGPTLESLAAEIAELRSRVAQLEARASGPQAPEVAKELPVVAAGEVATARPALEPLAAQPGHPQAEIHVLLQRMFTLALRADPDSRDAEQVEADFAQFLALVHHSRKGSPLLHQELFHYKWKPLCKRVKGYLSDPDDPTTFQITQFAPEKIDARTETVRVFVRADKRMPPPILLRRDADVDLAFRIDQSSL